MTTPTLFYQASRVLPTVERGEGIWLYDADGVAYLDGCSGAVVAGLGHAHPRILAAMAAQAAKVSFAYRTQFENRPAVELADLLVRELGGDLNRVFYVSGGSEAVESALKLARQYFLAVSQPERHRIVSRFPSYHGSTLGALSATGYVPLTAPFEPMIAEHLYVPSPSAYRCPVDTSGDAGDGTCDEACARELERVVLEQGPETIAAFILEPVGGASTGAIVSSARYFEMVTGICRKYGILTIYDEVMTGIGRTGAFCAFQHWQPEAHVDILALSKGLGAGYAPLGAMVARAEVVDAVLADGGQFAHGHTYAGNPLSCAIGLEVVRTVLDEGLVDNARDRGEQLLAGLAQIQAKSSIIGDVRGKGLLTGVEFVADLGTRRPFPPERDAYRVVTDAAFEEGLIVYPRRTIGGVMGDHVLIAPPLIVTEDQTADLLGRFERAVARAESHLSA
jgi:adenosylmethionine-8-amino-7-oxononanoate aminotransferase